MPTVNRESLAKALRMAEQAAERESMLAVLTGVLLEAERGALRLRATDLEVAAQVALDAEGNDEWRRVVDARLLGGLVGRLAGETVALALDGDQLVVSSGGSRFRLATMPADEFPELAAPQEAVEVSVTGAHLAAAIRRVAYAAAHSDQRPVLSGVYTVAEGDTLVLVATDSSRLAMETVPLACHVERRAGVIIPARAIGMWAKLAEDVAQDAKLLLGEKLAALRLGRWLLTTRLIEGNYPPYQQVLLSDPPHQVVFPREPMLEAVTRLSLLARRGPAVVVFEPSDDHGAVTVRAAVADAGEGVETVALAEGSQWPEGLRVAYQARFIEEMLRAVREDVVRYSVDDPTRQSQWTAGRLTYVVMPWRIDDSAVAKAA